MSHNASIVFRVLGAVLLIIMISVGGFMAFQAGQAQGYALGVASAASTGSQAPNTAGAAPVPYYGPEGMRMYSHFTPFMGFVGFIPALIGLFVVFGIFRMFFWGPRYMRHGHWGYGPYPCYPWPGESPCGEPGKNPAQTPGGQEAEKK